MYNERARGLSPRVWRRRRHAARCCTAALPTCRRPTSYRCCSRPAAAADDDDGDGASVPRITLRPLTPLFPVSIWNLHVATLNGNDRTRRGIGTSLRWSVVTTRRCGAPSSHCNRMRPRYRRRRYCRMHVASRRQSISRCQPRFCSVNCTPSVQHDVMARRRWKRSCVRSRAVCFEWKWQWHTISSFWTLAVYNVALFAVWPYNVSDWYLHEIKLTLGSAIHRVEMSGYAKKSKKKVRVKRPGGSVQGKGNVLHPLKQRYCCKNNNLRYPLPFPKDHSDPLPGWFIPR